MNKKKCMKHYKKIVCILVSTLVIVLTAKTFLFVQKASILNALLPASVADFNSSAVQGNQGVYEAPYSLYIPKIDLKSTVGAVPVIHWQNKEWNTVESSMQAAMNIFGAVSYPHSVLPGSLGKIIVTAHSSPPNVATKKTPLNTLFERLPELETDDQIFIASDGILYEYSVINTQIVSPTNAQILKQKYTDEHLVLITCYPVGSTQDRFIIRAVKVRETTIE